MFKRYLSVLSVLLALTVAFVGWSYSTLLTASSEIGAVMERCPLDRPSYDCELDMKVAVAFRRSIADALNVGLGIATGLVSLLLVSSVVRWVINGSRK